MPADSIRPPSGKPVADHAFRILSIDGGGIRGAIPAAFLAQLEDKLQQALAAAKPQVAARWREQGIDDPRISDCFHLIAGTSTGGLLAAGLAVAAGRRPKLSAREAGRIYREHGARIFRRPWWRKLVNPFTLFFPRYPLDQLRATLEDESLLDGAGLQEVRTGIVLTSYETNTARPRLFTGWGAPGAGKEPAQPREKLADAALATAAAPTYFPPEALGASRLVDGGVFAGNPTLAAISMALRRTTPPAPLSLDDLLVVSLGTGQWDHRLEYGSGGIIGWLRPRKGGEALLEALLGGQGIFAAEAAHMMLNHWEETLGIDSQATAWWDPTLAPEMVGGGPRFWRYQVELPGPWGLDDYRRVADLERLGRELAERHDQELARLAAALVEHGPVGGATGR